MKKLNKWTRAKEAEGEELKIMDEEKKEAEDEIQNGDFELLDTTARYSFVFFDTERSGGNIDNELIQLAAYSENNKMSKYIVHEGNICRHADRYSHKLECKKNKFWKGTDSYEAVTLEETAEELMDFCKEEKGKWNEGCGCISWRTG